MKSILISIHPEWVDKIASGEKTIEVRKSAPKEVPFKAYIYCTKAKPFIQKIRFGDTAISHTQISKNLYNGKVIGEFICDKVDKYEPLLFKGQEFYQNFAGREESQSCLSLREILKYGKGKTLYGWNISDLKIYDKPKELSEFFKPCSQSKNLDCDWLRSHNVCGCSVKQPITRPPQSYMYIEEVEEQNNNDN